MTDWLSDAIRSEGDVLFSTHPASEDLVLYVEAREELTTATVAAIEAHLRVCAACGEDLARLKEVAEEARRDEGVTGWLTSKLAPERRAEPDRRGGASWRRPSAWLPAAAIAAAAVIYLETTNPANRPERGIADSVGRAVVLRGEVERGTVTAVAPGPDDRVTLMFELPGDDSPISSCDLEIVAEGGETVACVKDAVALDDHGTFVITIEAAALGRGRYALVARDRLGERRFVFEVMGRRQIP